MNDMLASLEIGWQGCGGFGSQMVLTVSDDYAGARQELLELARRLYVNRRHLRDSEERRSGQWNVEDGVEDGTQEKAAPRRRTPGRPTSLR